MTEAANGGALVQLQPSLGQGRGGNQLIRVFPGDPRGGGDALAHTGRIPKQALTVRKNSLTWDLLLSRWFLRVSSGHGSNGCRLGVGRPRGQSPEAAQRCAAGAGLDGA